MSFGEKNDQDRAVIIDDDKSGNEEKGEQAETEEEMIVASNKKTIFTIHQCKTGEMCQYLL